MQNLNYGVVGNCRSAALVSEKGSIDWFCFPDFDSPSIFSKILDVENGGEFSIEVADNYSITQKYVNNTNILSTLFTSDEGSFEVLDFMPRYRLVEPDYYLAPEIYRYIRLLSGKPSFKVNYNPKMNYAREEVVHEAGKNYIKTSAVNNPLDCVYLYSSLKFASILQKKEIVLDEHQFLLLSHNQKLININIERVSLEYNRTKIYWLNWVNRSKKYKSYNELITRSVLVLKLMSYHPTGAVLAALTTSIPETIGEVRNWDYRFCWLRDASMSIETLMDMGHHDSARRFITFIKGILKTKQEQFQIMYGIKGEKALLEEELLHLSGFENSMPVRIGNAAYDQKQNDAFGYLMNVIYQYYKYFPGTLDEIEDIWEIVRNIMRTVIADWEKPDKGIWEIRNFDSHFVFSKVMCWVTLDRGMKIAQLLNMPDYVKRWKKEAYRIKLDIFKNGWNEDLQSFTQTYNNVDLDASLLLMEEYGFISASDERYKKTVQAIKNQLFYKGLMYRYINADDFGRLSSSFTICTFWLIRGLYVTGQKEEAFEIFNKIVGYSNHLGLFSEDLDFETKRQLGNFPQAYSHLALINTAALFSEERPISQFIRP
ncbi:MAG TPA: glycoside hydrolase family 15 protein [Prolixibacteraceae bacterium]|nr:glycoside hydrolase family 15 protein [Prolixibacteraceae bacterium]